MKLFMSIAVGIITLAPSLVSAAGYGGSTPSTTTYGSVGGSIYSTNYVSPERVQDILAKLASRRSVASSTNVVLFTAEMKRGTFGDGVVRLQAFLREKGFFTYSTNTGFFGPITQASLMAYQKERGITVTGIADIATQENMNADIVANIQGMEPKLVISVAEKQAVVTNLQTRLKEIAEKLFIILTKS